MGMLILSRKIDERIIIGGGAIKITVVDVRGDNVRLGIEAPPGVVIDREEVHRERMLNKVKKNVADPDDLSDLAELTKHAF